MPQDDMTKMIAKTEPIYEDKVDDWVDKIEKPKEVPIEQPPKSYDANDSSETVPVLPNGML